MDTLRSKVIKLAHDKPELRKHLLPILKEAAVFSGKPPYYLSHDDFLNYLNKNPDYASKYDKGYGGLDVVTWSVYIGDAYKRDKNIPIEVLQEASIIKPEKRGLVPHSWIYIHSPGMISGSEFYVLSWSKKAQSPHAQGIAQVRDNNNKVATLTLRNDRTWVLTYEGKNPYLVEVYSIAW